MISEDTIKRISRPFTIRENARCQSFPDDWQFCGNISSQYKQVFRQRDKSNNNDIGYFHQNMFSYFDGCEVPQAGWDVIYRNPDGIVMPDGDVVHTLYVEMKNKHNTMNSASSAKTYIKMQSQLCMRILIKFFKWE